MFKFSIKSASLALSVVCAMLISACSDDEKSDNGEIPALPTPTYESISAKYDVTSVSSDIESIELTADGKFIVMERDVNAYSAPKAKFAKAAVASRAVSGSVICGNFIQVSETEYVLPGFGSIVIEGDSNNAVSLIVTYEDGESTTVAASRASVTPDSELTKAMCRSWNLPKLGFKISVDGHLVFDKSRPSSEIWTLMTEMDKALADYINRFIDDPEDYYEPEVFHGDFYPAGLTLSRSGTYMVNYNNTIDPAMPFFGVAVWKWVDEAKRQFHYSWVYDNQDADILGFAGNAIVKFEGNTMVLVEENITNEEGHTMVAQTTYNCSLP